MDLNPIGKHCALQSCNVLDFLPIQCGCLQWFCKLHISPDLHNCSSLYQRPPEPSSSPVRPKCAFAGCNKASLATGPTVVDCAQKGESCDALPAPDCPGCQLSYCVDHRHMQSHSCTGLTAGEEGVKHAAARAILAQKFPGTGTLTSRTPVVARQRRDTPADPQKLAQLQKVNLMKLRHKAVPGDPKDRGSMVSVDQRIHVTVRLEVLGESAKESALWFRKTTITGKALDLVVQHFGLSYTTATLHLKQSSTEIGSHVLRNHLELSSQLEDGSTVVLTNSRSSGSLAPAAVGESFVS